jgi:hypothetical protein
MRLGVYEAGDGRQGLQEQWPLIGLTRLKISARSRLVASAKRQATGRVTVVTLFYLKRHQLELLRYPFCTNASLISLASLAGCTICSNCACVWRCWAARKGQRYGAEAQIATPLRHCPGPST